MRYRIRSRICELQLGDVDTVQLLGKAPLFPLHITIRGIFRLSFGTTATELLSEIERVAALHKEFPVRVTGAMNYPGDTLSFGFDSESVERLRKLQQAILPVVNQFRIKSQRTSIDNPT